MKLLSLLLLFLAPETPASGSDFVLTKTKHTDAVKVGQIDQAAKDSVEVTWIGKDRMRTEEGDQVTIVRNDLKKMYLIDSKAKTYKVLDLPVDMKKYIAPDLAPGIDAQMAKVKVSLTPTNETKKIKDWNATKYTLAMTIPKPKSSTFTQDIWATKDIAIDVTAWNDMSGSVLSVSPIGGLMAREFGKVAGIPVQIDSTQWRYGTEFKGRDEVTLVEQKEPGPGLYDVPKDYTELPFQPLGDPGEIRGSIKPVPPAPGDKPGETPVEKPVEKPVDKPVDKPVPH